MRIYPGHSDHFHQSTHAVYGRLRRTLRTTHHTSRITRLCRAVAAAVGAAALTCCAAACGSANPGSSATGQSSNSISFMLDWTPNTNHIGLYVAQEKGYYRDAGVNVKILPTAQAGAEVSVENGVADMGFTTLSNVAAFNAQGSDLTLVFDLTQKPVARWCALASRTDITSPKDFDGKTFVSFGSAEQTAVIRQMIKTAGGTGEFKTATAGTNTFATLTSGKGDFAGFYATWEGVESKLEGPALNCFIASDWGVPGNPDQLGFAVKTSWLKNSDHQRTLRKFLKATMRGYDYALAHPDAAADLLVKAASTARLDPKLTRASMEEIARNGYWTTSDPAHLPGTVDTTAAQAYLDFQYKAGTYADKDGKSPAAAPQAADLATNRYV